MASTGNFYRSLAWKDYVLHNRFDFLSERNPEKMAQWFDFAVSSVAAYQWLQNNPSQQYELFVAHDKDNQFISIKLMASSEAIQDQSMLPHALFMFLFPKTLFKPIEWTQWQETLEKDNSGQQALLYIQSALLKKKDSALPAPKFETVHAVDTQPIEEKTNETIDEPLLKTAQRNMMLQLIIAGICLVSGGVLALHAGYFYPLDALIISKYTWAKFSLVLGATLAFIGLIFTGAFFKTRRMIAADYATLEDQQPQAIQQRTTQAMQIKEAESKQLKSLLKRKHDIDHINGLVESIMTVIKPSLRDGRDFTHESLIFIQHCHTLHHKDPQGLEALISGDEKKWRAIMQPFILSIQALPQSEVDLLTDRLILAYLKIDPLLIDVIQRIDLQAIGRDQKIA